MKYRFFQHIKIKSCHANSPKSINIIFITLVAFLVDCYVENI